jgi:hypothetical protein
VNPIGRRKMPDRTTFDIVLSSLASGNSAQNFKTS